MRRSRATPGPSEAWTVLPSRDGSAATRLAQAAPAATRPRDGTLPPVARTFFEFRNQISRLTLASPPLGDGARNTWTSDEQEDAASDYARVTPQALIIAVALGAVAIALWLEVRFEPRTPRTIGQTLVTAAGAILGLQLLPTMLGVIVAGSESPARKMAGVFFVILPTLTYVWLASIWVLKLVQRTAHLR
jgi:hypothetical protein